jgi:GPH family glycoside/pentoside/hexuronide:cation symporter
MKVDFERTAAVPAAAATTTSEAVASRSQAIPSPERVAAAPPLSDERAALPLSTLLIYSAPGFGQAFMFMFTGMYLLKYSTDVLGVAPAVMGTIFLVSRLWDAISDPLAGYLSDRTESRWGRRRPWLMVGALPVCVVFFFMLTPPETLSGSALNMWMAVCVIGFYTTMTVYSMPHDALGAELTSNYSERNRVFGVKRAVSGIGTLVLFGSIGVIADSDSPRDVAYWLAVGGGIVSLCLMWIPAFFLRERTDYQGRGAKLPFKALMDVLRNPHARLLLVMFFLQQIGIGGVSLVAAYWADYVLGDAKFLMWLMGSLFLASVLAIPVWIRLGHHFEKRTLVLVSMATVGAALASVAWIPAGGFTLTIIVASIAGFAIACLDVVLPSIQADVIDYDELQTGERKEGVYFAVWHFAAKTSSGISLLLVGLTLSLVGLEADVEQTETAKLGIRALMSGMPLLTYGTGIFLFRRFSLTREAHAQIRRELDAR